MGGKPQKTGGRGPGRGLDDNVAGRGNLDDEVSLSHHEDGPRVDPLGIDPLLEALKAAHGHEPLNLRDVVFPPKNVSSHGRRAGNKLP